MPGIKERIQKIITQRRKLKEERTRHLDELMGKIKGANYELYNTNDKYLDYIFEKEWKAKYKEAYDNLNNLKKRHRSNAVKTFKYNYTNLNEIRKELNKPFILYEKNMCKSLFDNVEGRSLDEQQRECIVKDEINNLVVAGAGSGKTTTIVGKIKYLLKSQNYNPDQLLVLSFANASAAEMRERIEQETGVSIDVMTFHKLGKEIIAMSEGKQPNITGINLQNFIKDYFHSLMKDRNYLLLIFSFFSGYLKEYKSPFNFKSKIDYKNYLAENQIITLKNEEVKSYEEMEIANFLFVNGLNYKYEHYYKVDTSNMNYGRYKPDFFLPDYDIYIEHFGIDRNGNVAPFITGSDGKSAKKKYNESIKWKRNLHIKHNTTLIETYSYEKSEGVLTSNLKEKLIKNGVELRPRSADKIHKIILRDESIDNFINLIGTFVTNMKVKATSLNELKIKNNNHYTGHAHARNDAFISQFRFTMNITPG